eukprot:7607958-Pyramimonas_sp.AAC.1
MRPRRDGDYPRCTAKFARALAERNNPQCVQDCCVRRSWLQCKECAPLDPEWRASLGLPAEVE